MTAPLLARRLGKAEVHIDVPAVVGQFLTDLSPLDLIVELIQNELDAGSPATTITFAERALVCEGSGAPIDENGWKRLRYVLGAGGDVAAKADGIGAKNHGLRSAFLIGDTIVVQSAGHRIDLTVRGHQTESSRFYPAVWPKMPDPAAPAQGTRITVPYRTEALSVLNGDLTQLAPQTHGTIQALFDEAVEHSSARFIAASTPGKEWHYALTLSSATRNVTLNFECIPLRGRQAGLFRRTCRRTEPSRRSRAVLDQMCSAFELALPDDDHAKVPKLFRNRKRVLGEISWKIDCNARPLPSSGAIRYPIAYPIEHERSGYGFDISGPFISGRARHSLAEHPRNDRIRQAALAAFASLARRKLIPLFGAKAMDLAFSLAFPDSTAEELLVKALLDAGALPLASPVGVKSKTELPAVPIKAFGAAAKVVIASRSYQPTDIASSLVLLAAPTDSRLHPGIHARVVATLLRLQASGDKRISLFNEIDAARRVLIAEAPAKKEAAPLHWVEHARVALAELDVARHRVRLPPALATQLETEASLPTEAGTVAQWQFIRRSAKKVPVIPGIITPDILPTGFAKLGLLREGPFKIRSFDLNEFVSDKDFTNVINAGRQKFFAWLRQFHAELSPKALAKIALYPIWPGADGKFRALNDYCWPAAQHIRAMVHSVYAAPAGEVVSFPGLRKSGNGALCLRTAATMSELQSWYAACRRTSDELWEKGLVNESMLTVQETESSLDALLRTKMYRIEQVAQNHHAFSRSFEYKPIVDLHWTTEAVMRCRLLPSDLANGNFSVLYAQLGVQQKPTGPALLRALVRDPDRSLLFARLEAYRVLPRNLSDLAGEPIITVGGNILAPNTLTLPGPVNWWGKWKTPMEAFPDEPARVALLEQAGVVRSFLREDLSREFFEWLSMQSKGLQKEHLPQVVRHWAERRYGPSKWAQKYPTIPCIPAHGQNGAFDLISCGKAIASHSRLFLPDFPEIQEKILADHASLRLAVISVKGVADSTIDSIRSIGIQSLRGRVGAPVRVSISADIHQDPELENALKIAQSRTVVQQLPKMLPQFDVPTAALRRGWQGRMAAIKGVRVVEELETEYTFWRRSYPVPAHSAVDQSTGLLCIVRQSDRKLAFYAALAQHLFEENSSRLFAYGLLQAVEIRDQHIQFEFGGVAGEEGEHGSHASASEAGNLAADPPRKGHGLNEDALTPAVPSPNHLGDISDETRLSGRKQARAHSKRGQSATSDRRNSIEEAEQIDALKDRHYAWHCQACLGEYNVIDVAPPRSYVYLRSERRKLIEAHHVRHLQNQGAIGAKNLVVLCSFHHHYLGDRLSVSAVLEALTIAKTVQRAFPNNVEGTNFETHDGLLAVVRVDVPAGSTPLFFTKEHAAAWSKTVADR